MANRVVSLELHSEYCGNCAVCAGRQVGVNDERERIIKLLEQLLGYGDSEWDSSVMAVIALIKGEK